MDGLFGNGWFIEDTEIINYQYKGKVISESNGTPAGSVHVTLHNQLKWGYVDIVTVSTNSDGTFEMAGEYVIYNSAGYQILTARKCSEISDHGFFYDKWGSTSRFTNSFSTSDNMDITLRKIGPWNIDRNFSLFELDNKEWIPGNDFGFSYQSDLLSSHGIDTDNSGNIYVAMANIYEDQTEKALIRKIDPDRHVETYAGTSIGFQDGQKSIAQFNKPIDVAMDTNGNLIVADQGNFRIRKISADGQVSTVAGNGKKGDIDAAGTLAEFSTINGIAVSKDRTIYVSVGADWIENESHKIKMIDKDGKVKTIAGNGIAGYRDGDGNQAQFRNPSGITLSHDDKHLYVADTGNFAIRSIDLTTLAVTTIAGSPGIKGNYDGELGQARFTAPFDLAVSSSGTIYVSDRGPGSIDQPGSCNRRKAEVRKISPDGNVSSIGNLDIDDDYMAQNLALDTDGNLIISSPGLGVYKMVFNQ
jgi:DNA-binding beta-propeller fold protein YncE